MNTVNENASAPQIVEFGPYRVIGVRYAGKNENAEIKALWDNSFLPRISEIVKPGTGEKIAFGLCRCLPGVTDGSFEYIAAAPASADAPIPDGMVDVQIAACTYVVFPVESLSAIMHAFEQSCSWLESHPEWEAYCSPAGCDCATHPGFELYPESFGVDGKLFVYIPIKKK
jgi:predicted transcriptional regulator YdeE